MIKISGDIELDPGPKQKQNQSLSICHWNLNNIPARNFQKLEPLQGIKLTSCASLRLFLIQIFHVMTKTCSYQDLT